MMPGVTNAGEVDGTDTGRNRRTRSDGGDTAVLDDDGRIPQRGLAAAIDQGRVRERGDERLRPPAAGREECRRNQHAKPDKTMHTDGPPEADCHWPKLAFC